MCEQYSTCAEYRTKQQKEPMIVMQVPIIRGKKRKELRTDRKRDASHRMGL